MPSKKKNSKPAVTSLPKKPAGTKDDSAVKGGRKQDALFGNHNQTLRQRSAR